MTTNELFDKLEELKYDLFGQLSYNGTNIKWLYDGFGYDMFENMEDHLNDIYDSDKTCIMEYVDENEFHISEPETDDTYIFFYIEK